MSGYRLTVRQGAKVEREKFAELDEAVHELRRRAEEISANVELPSVSMLREFKSEERVAARLEISTGGWLRGNAAGVDVMGDGALVAFAGGIGREPLTPRDGETAFELIRRKLARQRPLT